MFIDRAKIFIKAGDGGDGCVSFYTEKYISNGGPDGGDGGKGGDVIFRADDRKSSLIDFRYNQHFKAAAGERGMPKFCNGRGGANLYITVPTGTVIYDDETGGVIADMFSDGDEVTVLKGGSGGKGNSRFKTSRRHTPRFAQKGQIGEQHAIRLELKTIADVGLVGFPNVGKSTLLSVVSAARPKIANYHFTTLSPNLGVVKYYDNAFTVADIPGLIEGASEGAGLGHDFLRHIDRVRLIVHVVDISGSEDRDPVDDYKKINEELKAFNEHLGSLPQIVALNKADVLADNQAVKRFKRAVKAEGYLVSAATGEGIKELIGGIYNKLSSLPPLKPMDFEPFVYAPRDSSSFEVYRDDDGSFVLTGGLIDELSRNVLLSDNESFSFFQKKLKEFGVIKAIRAAGAKDGDSVRVMDVEFEYWE